MRLSPVIFASALVACTSSDAADPNKLDGGGLDAEIIDGGPSLADAGDGQTEDAGTDAGTGDALDAAADAGGDAEVDVGADAAICPSVLLVGGSDVTEQGWSLGSAVSPYDVTYGADYVRLETSTAMSARTSGALLLARAGALEIPFTIEVEMLVERVNAHNSLDSAATILGSFTTPFSSANERSQMVYLDSERIGWADDTQASEVSVIDGSYHTYTLAVDAQNVARFSVDGVLKLTRNNFTTNGTLAIGDQTNDPNVDSAVRIRSVKKHCL